MANLRPAGQTHAGFLNNPRVDFYKLIIIYIEKNVKKMFKKC